MTPGRGWNSSVWAAPRAAPTSWARTNGSTEAGAIPAKVSVNIRPMVTAGLAKEVDDVKRYAEPIQAGTRTGPSRPLPVRVSAPMIHSSPAVATTSPSSRFAPVRSFVEISSAGRPNIRLASIAPVMAPATWAGMYAAPSPTAISRRTRATAVTAGLKWAPEIGPNVQISRPRTITVASMFISSCTPTSSVRVVAMIPDPTTAVTRIIVPRYSASTRRVAGVRVMSTPPPRGCARWSRTASRRSRWNYSNVH